MRGFGPLFRRTRPVDPDSPYGSVKDFKEADDYARKISEGHGREERPDIGSTVVAEAHDSRVLRREIETLRERLRQAEAERDAALRRRDEAEARAERLARQLRNDHPTGDDTRRAALEEARAHVAGRLRRWADELAAEGATRPGPRDP